MNPNLLVACEFATHLVGMTCHSETSVTTSHFQVSAVSNTHLRAEAVACSCSSPPTPLEHKCAGHNRTAYASPSKTKNTWLPLLTTWCGTRQMLCHAFEAKSIRPHLCTCTKACAAVMDDLPEAGVFFTYLPPSTQSFLPAIHRGIRIRLLFACIAAHDVSPDFGSLECFIGWYAESLAAWTCGKHRCCRGVSSRCNLANNTSGSKTLRFWLFSKPLPIRCDSSTHFVSPILVNNMRKKRNGSGHSVCDAWISHLKRN